MTQRPLDGIRVVDFTQWLAGPFATSILGDMGADVVKVERPDGGDGTRNIDRHYAPGLASYFLGINRSKRSIAVDLRNPEGQAAVRRLCEKADVVIENFRGGVMARLGLDYERLASENPRLVYCSISSFGPEGPLSKKAGMDIIVQAQGGIMGLTGEPGRAPVKVGSPIGDYAGAFLAVQGVLLALLARERFGFGQKVDISLLDGQVAMLANFLPGFVKAGEPSEPQGSGHPQLVPYQAFAASDTYLIVACLTEGFWQGLCRAIERPDLPEDPRFRTNADRVTHRQVLVPIIAEHLRARTAEEWITRLEAEDVPCCKVNRLADVVRDTQVRRNRMLVELESPQAGRYTTVGVPIGLAKTPGRISRPAPALGEHTDEVLAEAGLTPADLARLRAAGAVR